MAASRKCFYIEKQCPESTKNSLKNLFVDHFKHLQSPKSDQHIAKALDMVFEPHSPAHIIGIQNEVGSLAGFCFFNVGVGVGSGGKYIWLNDIHIQKEERGKGFGSELLQFFLRWAKANNCVYIAAMIHDWNTHSQNLFKKMGFDMTQTIFWVDIDID